jgi:hypothetical protein
MSHFLGEALHMVHVALTFIGSGAVLAFVGWLYKRRQENFEDKVLLMFQNSQNQLLRTATGIHNDYRGQYLKDVPVWVILPTHTNWRAGLKWRLRTVPYQVRHVWRMKFFMPRRVAQPSTALTSLCPVFDLAGAPLFAPFAKGGTPLTLPFGRLPRLQNGHCT